MRRFWPILRRHWVWLLLAPPAMLLEAAMDLMQPTMMGRIIDRGITEGNQAEIFAAGGWMLLYALLGAVGGLACTYFSSRAALQSGRDLRSAIFRKIQSLSFAEADAFTPGSLMTRAMGDVDTLQHMVVMFTRMLIRTPMLLVGSLVIVCRTDARMTIPLLASAPFLAVIVVVRVRMMRARFREVQKCNDRLNTMMQENLDGIRVVKACVQEDAEERRFAVANGAWADTSYETGRIMAYMGPLIGVVQQLTTVALLFLAAREVDRGLLRAGGVVAIVNYASQVTMSLVMLGFEIMHISRAQVSASRILEVLGTEPSVRDGAFDDVPEDGSVRFEDVSFAYPGSTGKPVVRHADLEFKSGGLYTVLGATGSGKSSLVNLIPRFYDTGEGRVLVGGRDVRDYTLGALRSSVGVVLQDTRLFTGTIADNIRYGRPDASLEEVERAARLAQADGFIREMPGGYAAQVAQGGLSLSGGQRQRVAIARALLLRPKILVMDDSVSAVDTVTERAIMDAVRTELGGTTVILVAQRVGTAAVSDGVVVLEDGEVVGAGRPEELRETCAVYREILESQNV